MTFSFPSASLSPHKNIVYLFVSAFRGSKGWFFDCYEGLASQISFLSRNNRLVFFFVTGCLVLPEIVYFIVCDIRFLESVNCWLTCTVYCGSTIMLLHCMSLVSTWTLPWIYCKEQEFYSPGRWQQQIVSEWNRIALRLHHQINVPASTWSVWTN